MNEGIKHESGVLLDFTKLPVILILYTGYRVLSQRSSIVTRAKWGLAIYHKSSFFYNHLTNNSLLLK